MTAVGKLNKKLMAVESFKSAFEHDMRKA